MGKLVVVASLLLMMPTGQRVATDGMDVDLGVDLDVDLELVLAADVSSSMSSQDRRLQVDGFSAAFRDSDVVAAIMHGPRGRIAVTYVEWSDWQEVIIPWRVIHDQDSAFSLASLLSEIPAVQTFGSTNLTGAIGYSMLAIEENGLKGSRRVIDISGDGENNTSVPPDTVRNEAISAGMTINGLPLNNVSDNPSAKSPVTLDAYFKEHVIGGEGAFVIVADSPQEFGRAIRLKLLREIAGPAYPVGSRVSDLSSNSGNSAPEKVHSRLAALYRHPGFSPSRR